MAALSFLLFSLLAHAHQQAEREHDRLGTGAVMKESAEMGILPFNELASHDEASEFVSRVKQTGHWWARVGKKVFSPAIAGAGGSSLLNCSASKCATSGRSGLMSLAHRAYAEGEVVDGMYVAVGHPSKVPRDVLKRRVGGEGNFHFVHWPEMETDRRLHHQLVAQLELENPGARRGFHSFLELKAGFMALMPYQTGSDYTRPESPPLKQEKDCVAHVTESRYMEHLRNLVDFGTRSVGAPNMAQIRQKLASDFENFGYKVVEQEHVRVETEGGDGDSWESVESGGLEDTANVIAIKHGTGNKKHEVVVVGAHYDSRPYWPSRNAPGAVDNGSGVAALLSMAEAFGKSKIENERTIVFAAFTGEEQGLYGSKRFVGDFSSDSHSLLQFQGDSRAARSEIVGAIIMDEIGWQGTRTPGVTLETRQFCRGMMDHLADSSATHNGDELEMLSSFNPFGSDHMPFLNRGLQSVLTINANDDAYPSYHSSNDRIENVTPKLAAMITKMNLGALVRMAGGK